MATTVRGGSRERPRRHSEMQREALAFYVCISPWLVGLIIFKAYPMLRSLYLSLTAYDLFTAPRFIGMRNYAELLGDKLFWHSLEVTVLYTLGSVLGSTAIGLASAMLLNQKDVKGINFWRTIFYLPSILSGVAVAVLWIYVFNPDYGLMNTVLGWVGIHGPGWITSPEWALPSLILMSWWQIGQPMVIFLAGLKGIPGSLYDVAEVDGAGAGAKFWYVTLPMLSSTIYFNVVMALIGSFQVFTSALVMTAGGPQNSTLFYVLYLYQNAFQFFRMGYASALAWILFVIVIVCTLLVVRSSRYWVYYEAERQ